ncbi:ATP-binding cassette domain-containing protein [Nocardioides sp. TF02-7]|uniref:ATP-binding cassette domain-containing protein n=1 Tax=Nocardioides sp. TF02-7 TaxID=2917724 RepID=UPI0023D9B099|nr:ATP-binding cassette domain-containing protein [Nocardioides sp. TF02-7]
MSAPTGHPAHPAHTGPAALIARDLGVGFPDRPVLQGIDLVAQPGRRIALVGENGAGKSTLLRALAGTLPPRAQVTGEVARPDDLVLLSQEPPFRDDDTVGDVLALTLRPLREAVAAVERLAGQVADPAVAEEYAAALDFALDHDAWDADRRALAAAERLGLGALDHGRRVGSLSGGQRTRLALATLMTRRPRCLLLDEPTNHLDDEAIGVLVGFLRDLPGVVVLASHDRVFLDEVATDLFDLDPTAFGTDGRGGRRFGGGWTAYEQARRDARRRWEEAYAAQQEELDRLRAATAIGTGAVAPGRGPRDNDKFIHAFKGANVDRAVARRKKDAQRRLEAAEQDQVRKPPERLRLRVTLTAAASGGRVVVARDLEVAGRLRVPRLDVAGGEHLLVTGENGVGKSTLLGVLSGRLRPTGGRLDVAAAHCVELEQDPVFPSPGRSALATYRDLVGEVVAEQHPLRGLGLLHPRDHQRPVGLLSVGQRRRLALAAAVATGPDLLLLDEPTNHISLSLVGELEEGAGGQPRHRRRRLARPVAAPAVGGGGAHADPRPGAPSADRVVAAEPALGVVAPLDRTQPVERRRAERRLHALARREEGERLPPAHRCPQGVDDRCLAGTDLRGHRGGRGDAEQVDRERLLERSVRGSRTGGRGHRRAGAPAARAAGRAARPAAPRRCRRRGPAAARRGTPPARGRSAPP